MTTFTYTPFNELPKTTKDYISNIDKCNRIKGLSILYKSNNNSYKITHTICKNNILKSKLTIELINSNNKAKFLIENLPLSSELVNIHRYTRIPLQITQIRPLHYCFSKLKYLYYLENLIKY